MNGYTFGFSHAPRSSETAAVVEATFCSLYSTLDCFRWVFCDIYRKHQYQGIPESTRKLFQAGQKQKLDERIPRPIRDQFLLSETWFNQLRTYRDEMTHSDVGNCHHDKKKLRYIHPGLGTPSQALLIEDVIGEIDKFRDSIISFLGIVFLELNGTLKDEETEQFCGIFGGRFYQRFVKPSEAVDFHAGRCKSLEWFEKDDNPLCPLRESCGAYARAKNSGMGDIE